MRTIWQHSSPAAARVGQGQAITPITHSYDQGRPTEAVNTIGVEQPATPPRGLGDVAGRWLPCCRFASDRGDFDIDELMCCRAQPSSRAKTSHIFEGLTSSSAGSVGRSLDIWVDVKRQERAGKGRRGEKGALASGLGAQRRCLLARCQKISESALQRSPA